MCNPNPASATPRSIYSAIIMFTESCHSTMASLIAGCLSVPGHYTRVCITPLGIPVEWPDSPPKKKLEEFIAYETL